MFSDVDVREYKLTSKLGQISRLESQCKQIQCVSLMGNIYKILDIEKSLHFHISLWIPLHRKSQHLHWKLQHLHRNLTSTLGMCKKSMCTNCTVSIETSELLLQSGTFSVFLCSDDSVPRGFIRAFLGKYKPISRAKKRGFNIGFEISFSANDPGSLTIIVEI